MVKIRYIYIYIFLIICFTRHQYDGRNKYCIASIGILKIENALLYSIVCKGALLLIHLGLLAVVTTVIVVVIHVKLVACDTFVYRILNDLVKAGTVW